MEPEKSVDTPPTQPTPLTSPYGSSRKIFVNTEGLRAGWRLLVYVALAAGLFLCFRTLLEQFWHFRAEELSAGSLFLTELINFAAVFGAAALMSVLERRPVDVYGLPAHTAFGKL